MLSPSLNDPYTAINCIDRPGAAVCHLSDRQTLPPHGYDKAGRLRLVLDVPTYEGIVDAAFTQICQSTRTTSARAFAFWKPFRRLQSRRRVRNSERSSGDTPR